MEEQFVPYVLALKLKELGFKAHYFADYRTYNNKIYLQGYHEEDPCCHEDGDCGYTIICGAPIWQQAFDWFLEKYNIHGIVLIDINAKYYWSIQDTNGKVKTNATFTQDFKHFKLFKDARLACLEKLIEFAEEKSEAKLPIIEKEKENTTLIRIYFKKCYLGFGEVTEEEERYITENVFKCIITEETKNNGYSSDKKQVQDLLEVGKEYTLLDMNVGRSESTLRLVEFPDQNFNTVNFIITKV